MFDWHSRLCDTIINALMPNQMWRFNGTIVLTVVDSTLGVQPEFRLLVRSDLSKVCCNFDHFSENREEIESVNRTGHSDRWKQHEVLTAGSRGRALPASRQYLVLLPSVTTTGYRIYFFPVLRKMIKIATTCLTLIRPLPAIETPALGFVLSVRNTPSTVLVLPPGFGQSIKSSSSTNTAMHIITRQNLEQLFYNQRKCFNLNLFLLERPSYWACFAFL